jgi:hypothetical protein
MTRKKSIVDASSAILLAKTGLFASLTATYRVVVAEAVYGEIAREGYPGGDDFIEARKVGAIRVLPAGGPDRPGPEEALSGPGERETIRLFLRGEGDFVIIDDRKGAGFCKSAGIPYINALLYPRILLLSGALSDRDYHNQTGQLLKNGRYSTKIAAIAADASRQQLERFWPP